MNKIFKKAVVLLAALFVVTYVSAQNEGSKAAIERAALENIWLSNTENAAGGMVDAPALMANAYFGFDHTKGDFKRTQVGNKINSISFHTDGGGIYENIGGMFIWGDFTYTKDAIAGARWNATLANPLRDMPFFVADENVSKWRNQNYNMGFKVGAPLFRGRLVVGFTGYYEAGIAAKQLDPRPITRVSNLNVVPAILFRINDKNTIGADFHYTSYREDGSAENIIHLRDQKGWEMVAPGFFNDGLIASFGGINKLRNYNANALGGGLQYSFIGKKFKILATGDYLYRVEDALCNYTKPQMSGTVKHTTWSAALAAQFNLTEEDRFFVKVKHSNKDYRGIEYFQTYDNTYEVQSYITDAEFERSKFTTKVEKVNIDYLKTNGGDAYTWKVGVEGSYTRDGFWYYVPASSRKVNTLFLGANGSYNFEINDVNAVTLDVNAGFSKNKKGTFDYNGVKLGNKAFTEFALIDFMYMCADYSQMGFNLTYSFKGIKSLSSLFCSIGYQHIRPETVEDIRGVKDFPMEIKEISDTYRFFKRRDVISFKVGITF
ncbi:MAG: hypothetical protein J6Z32_00845 [Bacteroidales bacterium]|nr:hypothetical protein [Bacteroidales bacterium]